MTTRITTYEDLINALAAAHDGQLIDDARYNTLLVRARTETIWPVREDFRFVTGEYRRLPVVIEDWTLSTGRRVQSCSCFVHLSVRADGEDPTTVFVAYTPDSDAGERDRQIRTRFTRFLMKFHGATENEAADLNHRLRSILEQEANKTAMIANNIEGEETLQARLLREYGMELLTGDDIVEAYEACYNGITPSCMTYRWDRWSYREASTGDRVHPASVYARQPEMALLVKRNTNGNITGRVVLHLPSLTYQRIYGDYVIQREMLAALTKLGFKTATWNGVWLPRIKVVTDPQGYAPPTPGVEHFLMPWTDGDCIRATMDEANDRFVLIGRTAWERLDLTTQLAAVTTQNNPTHIVAVDIPVACASCQTLLRGAGNIILFKNQQLCRDCVLQQGGVMAYTADSFWFNGRGASLRNGRQPVPMLPDETALCWIYGRNTPVRISKNIFRHCVISLMSLLKNFNGMHARHVVQDGEEFFFVGSGHLVVARDLVDTCVIRRKDARYWFQRGDQTQPAVVTEAMAQLLLKSKMCVEGRALPFRGHYRTTPFALLPTDLSVKAFTTAKQTRRMWTLRSQTTEVEGTYYANTPGQRIPWHKALGNLKPYVKDPTRWNFAKKRRAEQEQAA